MSKVIKIILLASTLMFGISAHAGQPGYAETVRLKLGSGFANALTGFVEIPKNMINTTNQSGNVFFGIVGGGGKGLLHMLGRTIAGVVDVVTFPIPTRPIPDPPVVWERFYTDTRYGPFFSDVRDNPYPPKPARPPAATPAPGQQIPGRYTPPPSQPGGSYSNQ